MWYKKKIFISQTASLQDKLCMTRSDPSNISKLDLLLQAATRHQQKGSLFFPCSQFGRRTARKEQAPNI
jgi:hypothetical protein